MDKEPNIIKEEISEIIDRKVEKMREVDSLKDLKNDGEWCKIPLNRVNTESIFLFRWEGKIWSGLFNPNASTRGFKEFGGQTSAYAIMNFVLGRNNYDEEFFWNGENDEVYKGNAKEVLGEDFGEYSNSSFRKVQLEDGIFSEEIKELIEKSQQIEKVEEN